jgi:hypothetical protein
MPLVVQNKEGAPTMGLFSANFTYTLIHSWTSDNSNASDARVRLSVSSCQSFDQNMYS